MLAADKSALQVELSQQILHHDCDYTPYEGLAVKGWPVRTLLRGQTICLDGTITGSPGTGRYLDRATSQAFPAA